MGIAKSISNAVCRTADAVGSVAGMAEETVQIGTNYVHNRAKAQLLTDKKSVIIETAKTLNELQKELDDSEKLNATYESLLKDW